ncbi:nuclear transport factor 2 family protein [Luteimonas sp. SX5]|uniref:Nuclear transport factor 2 family protein n=1 Tax=Luteimonas galliterrae TaxID=2940486 RepID=A0ABT0MH84_9GAMM|nr:nuclear transport factor 2 family protein [Luteimonas galliterrae]MCL1634236.1 nuclear transport factor 2 family protein [Luteimonas galliterrae]
MNARFSKILLAWGLSVAAAIACAAPAAAQTIPGQSNGTSQQDESARAGIRATIQHYFQGHATGDPSHFRKAFLPTAHVEIIRDGKFTSWTLDEYCALFKGTPAADESSRVRSIDFVDVSNNTAIAKVTLDYPKLVFTDYFLLLKIGDEWKIANKIASNRPKDTGKQ